jgi:hypothetical protein
MEPTTKLNQYIQEMTVSQSSIAYLSKKEQKIFFKNCQTRKKVDFGNGLRQKETLFRLLHGLSCLVLGDLKAHIDFMSGWAKHSAAFPKQIFYNRDLVVKCGEMFRPPRHEINMRLEIS